MDQRALRSFESPPTSSPDASPDSAPTGLSSPFFALSPESDADKFRHQVWQVYRETYKDEDPHQHPIFAQLRIDRPRYVAMQIYAGLMNGHSLAESVAAADIEFDRFEDKKWANHPRIHRFDALGRSYIWGKLRGIRSRSRIIGELEDRPNTRRKLGYGSFDGTRRCPHQTNFNEAWNDRFGPDLRAFIDDVVHIVREFAYDNNRLIETTELLLPDDRDEAQELTKDQIRRIVNEMVGYITPNYSFEREGAIQHDKNIFFKLLAHCGFSRSSVHGGGDTFGWSQIDDDDPPHGKTIMDLIKAIPEEKMMGMFREAIGSIFEALSEQVGIYENVTAPVAIDTTTIESDAKWKRVTVESISNPDDSDWNDRKQSDTYDYIEENDLDCLTGADPDRIWDADFRDEKKQAAAERVSDVVRYVHGTKSGDDFMYAWEFAGAAIAHPTCPLVYGMEPLPRKHRMEDHVKTFIDRAQELVTVSEVYMDSAYAQTAVHNLFHYGNGFRTEDTLDMPYVMKMRENEDVKKAVLKEENGKGTLTTRMDDNEKDVSVAKDYSQFSQGEGYSKTTLVALPKRDYENGGEVDVEDKVTDRVVFCTNRTEIDADNAHDLLRGPDEEEIEDPERREKAKHKRGYTNRWLIEIGFQKIKDFLAFTKSGHPGVRLFYTLYATLLFDVWMTVDRTIKKREYELADDIDQDDTGPEYATTPRLSADVLSVIVANYLRPIT